MKKKHKLLIIICSLVFFIGLERLYYRQNGGFSIAKITSQLPATAASFSSEELQNADLLLDQSFHFLGYGGTSFVFLGDDKKTVLKLFKHQHLFSHSVFFRCFLPGTCDLFRVSKILEGEKKHLHKRQAFFFNSCSLAYQNVKEDSGLIFLCLKPSSYFARQIKLIDAWRIPHYFDLSRTEFALQKKADLFFPTLEALLKGGRKAEIKAAIDDLLSLLSRRCEKGIADRDPNLSINFGFVEGRVIEFDLGSYFVNPMLNTPFAQAKERYFSTYALQNWLEKHSPDLLEYLLDRIAQAAYETLP